MANAKKATTGKNETIPYEETTKGKFENAKDLKSATALIWSPSFKLHEYYQHYTTLSRVLVKLIERKWWLARGDSDALNDCQESMKFGSRRIVKRTYQASFCHGKAESVALWGLYTPMDPFAIRITIPSLAIEKWLACLRKGEIHYLKGESKIGYAEFRDIIYAAVDFRDKDPDQMDIKRANNIYWEGVNCRAESPSLPGDVKNEEYTCWLKDYEWRHERESRLCVRPASGKHPKGGAWVDITQDLVDSMKFTLSPWAGKEIEDEICGILREALAIKTANEVQKISSERIRRSVLQNAIKLKFHK